MRCWLLAAAVTALPLPALAQQPDAAKQTVLHLSQSAERRVARDLLHADLRAEARGADPHSVEAAINRTMQRALDEAKAVKGVDVATGAYLVNRETPAGSPPDWAGSQALFLESTDSRLLLALTASLQGEGLVMSDLEYEVSPAAVRGVEGALTSEALSALSQRASAIAQQLHLSVLSYRDVAVGNAETGGSPVRFGAAMTAATPTPVAAPGEATVRLTVSAEIVLGAKPP
jgi:uncharacterized protein